MTTVVIIVVPFRVLEFKNWYLLGKKNIFVPRLSNEILVPFRVFFDNF